MFKKKLNYFLGKLTLINKKDPNDDEFFVINIFSLYIKSI